MPKATAEPNPFPVVIGYGLLMLLASVVLSLAAAIFFGEDHFGFRESGFFAPF
jgi:hypothetical protein